MFEKKCKLQGIKSKDDKTAFACYFAWGCKFGCKLPPLFYPRAMLPAQILDEHMKHLDITSCIKYRDQQYMY